MPLTREEIKFQNKVRREENSTAWVSPHHGDGGWHTTPGCERYTTEWEPLFDRILVRLLPEKDKYARVVRPENAAAETTTRIGIVLKLGTGKRDPEDLQERIPFSVGVGDEVVIGKWSDWDSEAGDVVICQEADIRVIVRRNGETYSGC
jgi:co-chaperonin GroES (HSP10)